MKWEYANLNWSTRYRNETKKRPGTGEWERRKFWASKYTFVAHGRVIARWSCETDGGVESAAGLEWVADSANANEWPSTSSVLDTIGAQGWELVSKIDVVRAMYAETLFGAVGYPASSALETEYTFKRPAST